MGSQLCVVGFLILIHWPAVKDGKGLAFWLSSRGLFNLNKSFSGVAMNGGFPTCECDFELSTR